MQDDAIDRVERALQAFREGRMVVLVDDEDRENEGDLCMAAERVTPEAINFMATHGRGLICLALSEERVAQLGLPMMVDENRASRSTAFTVSIEAREGVTTGISAADRAHTIRVAVAPDARPEDLVSPGHVFPLRARPGGVLQRTGHTEGAVDLARLAGLCAAGVICEIMREDGTMARAPDLEAFAARHRLPLLSIADLVQYRMQREKQVRRVASAPLETKSGRRWVAHRYELPIEGRRALALTLGVLERERPTLVRVHGTGVLSDALGVRVPSRFGLAEAMARIEEEGCGALLLLPRPGDVEREVARLAGLAEEGPQQVQGEVLREFGFGAQVLADLGLGRIRLLTSRPRRLPSLEGYGLEVVEQILPRGGAEGVPASEPGDGGCVELIEGGAR